MTLEAERHNLLCMIWSELIRNYKLCEKLSIDNQARSRSDDSTWTYLDESIHGVAVGFFAQQLFNNFNKEKQDELKIWGYELLLDLYQNELKYTDDLYAETGLSSKVKSYVRYNANKSLMNLGLDTMFPDEEVDPIVMNGIRTDSVTHDFFSQKGNSYGLADVKPITDDTFRIVELMARR